MDDYCQENPSQYGNLSKADWDTLNEPDVREGRTLIVQKCNIEKTNSFLPGSQQRPLLNDPFSNEVPLQRLISLFRGYGSIESAWVRSNAEATEDFGYITFVHCQDALRAYVAAHEKRIKMDGSVLTATLIMHDSALIDKLTDKCLLKIFSMLDNASKLSAEGVCKSWRGLALRSWYDVKELYISDNQPSLTLKKTIMRCGPYLKKIEFNVDDEKFFPLVQKYCVNVEKLTIIDWNHDYEGVDITDWIDVIRGFKKLKSFKFGILDKNIAYDLMAFLPASVEKVKIVAQHKPDQSLYPQTFHHLRNLRKLTISGFHIVDYSIQDLKKLYSLTTLNLENSAIECNILRYIQNLQRITVLKIPRSKIIKQSLIPFIRNHWNLNTLDISQCYNVTDELMRIISTLPHLECLIIKNLPRLNLLFLEPMPKLTYLDCQGCFSIYPGALIKILKSSPLLETLNVRDIRINSAFRDLVASVVATRNGGRNLKLIANHPRPPSTQKHCFSRSQHEGNRQQFRTIEPIIDLTQC